MQIIKFSTIVIIAVAAIKFGVLKALGMFLLVGAIPGTTYSLPASAMFIVLGMIVWLVFCQPTVNRSVYRSIQNARHTKRVVSAQARMPRRRFSQI